MDFRTAGLIYLFTTHSSAALDMLGVSEIGLRSFSKICTVLDLGIGKTLASFCWTFTVDINILVIFARTGETGNKGKGRENRCRTRDFIDRVCTCYEFILCELYYKK